MAVKTSIDILLELHGPIELFAKNMRYALLLENKIIFITHNYIAKYCYMGLIISI